MSDSVRGSPHIWVRFNLYLYLYLYLNYEIEIRSVPGDVGLRRPRFRCSLLVPNLNFGRGQAKGLFFRTFDGLL
jgi:hypothetical protein